MAGIGSAIGGFAQGFAGGVRLKSEMEDAEARRGLMGLQKQSAQLALDNETQFADLSKQIGAEINAFNTLPDKDDPTQFDAHYTRLGGLLKQQAVLAKKDPFEVDKSINAMRKDKYAEKIYQASSLLQAGDDSGLQVLKPVFNNMFKDGNTLQGGTFNKETDSFDLTYLNKAGETVNRSVKREELANRIVPLALNVADAVKLDIKAREDEKDRKFKAGENDKDRDFKGKENDKDRGLKVKLNDDDNKTRITTANIGLKGTIYSADKGAESRSTARANGRDDKDYDDFQGQINDALGWNKNNVLSTPEDLARRNRDATTMTGIFNATREFAGKKLSAYEAAQVAKGIENKTAKFTESNGFTVVDVGGVRAVLPKQ